MKSDYDKIIETLPDIIHLSNFTGFQYSWELDYKDDNVSREILRHVSYKTLLRIKHYIQTHENPL